MDASMGKRHRIKNIIVLCVALVVAFLLAEFMIRLVAPQETGTSRLERFPAIYQDSDVMSYEFKPGARVGARIPDRPYSISINNQGTRGPAFGPKADDEYRVVLLGDSMTFGQGLDDNQTIAALLERQLASHLGKKVTVINAGVPGWGPDQEALMLRQRVPAWQPDMVFWLVFLGNDIEDVGRHSLAYDDGVLTRVTDPAKYVENGRAVHNVSRTVGGWWAYVKPLQQPLDDHSHLYALVKKTIFTPFVVGEENTAIFTLDDEQYLSWQRQTEGIVREAVQQNKEEHPDMPVVLVLLPHRAQYGDTGLMNISDMNASRKQWRAFANQGLLPLMDSYDVLSDCGNGCYYPLDGHFNQDGASRVAQLLDAYVQAD
jgi:lysophospholipase L1-like esterase